MIREKLIDKYLQIFEIEDFSLITTGFINSKYRALSKKYHPDMPTGSHEKFVLLNEAKDFFLNNIDVIKKVLETKNNKSLQEILSIEQLLHYFKNNYEICESSKPAINLIKKLFVVVKVNVSVKFFFFSMLILSKVKSNEMDIDSAINSIASEAIEELSSIDYNKINLERIFNNIELFKRDVNSFTDEDRLFYSIYIFYYLFAKMNVEDKKDISLKIQILFKQYLREIDEYNCYSELMPSEQTMKYYLAKYKREGK